MGSVIPPTDQKLGKSPSTCEFRHRSVNDVGAIDRHGEWNVNAASNFVAQYTTRQEYRYAEALPGYDGEWASFLHLSMSYSVRVIVCH